MVATDLSRRDLLKIAGAAVLASAAPLPPVRAQAAEKPVLTAGDRFIMGEWGGEPIEWRVLNVPGNTALAISEYGIDCKLFNNNAYKGNSWHSSDLYDWLSNDFLAGAFNESERAAIQEVTCLSVEEAEKYFKDDDDRICYPTAYARQQDAWGLRPTGSEGWWLRSPGRVSTHAVLVNHDGHIYSSGNYVNSSGLAVRPALWLNL